MAMPVADKQKKAYNEKVFNYPMLFTNHCCGIAKGTG